MGGAYDHPSPLSCVYRIRTVILGKTPSILHNQTTTVEAMNSEHDQYITTESAVADPKPDEFFVSATMFDQAEIDSHLPDDRAMEEAKNFLLQDASSLSSVSDTSVELPAQEADGLSYILGWLAKIYNAQFLHLNLGEHTFKKKDEHSYSQPPSFVQHLSCGRLIEPSDAFLRLWKKMEQIFLKMNPEGSIMGGERITERIASKIKKHVNELPLDIIRCFAKQRVIVRMRYLNLKAAAEQLERKKKESLHSITPKKQKKNEKNHKLDNMLIFSNNVIVF